MLDEMILIVDPEKSGEMSTREAVAYLNEWVTTPISPKVIYGMRSLIGQPAAEKRGRRLVFTRAQLDVFLAEYGRDPMRWHVGWSRDSIADLRARGIHDPQIEEVIRMLDPSPDDWHPDDARP